MSLNRYAIEQMKSAHEAVNEHLAFETLERDVFGEPIIKIKSNCQEVVLRALGNLEDLCQLALEGLDARNNKAGPNFLNTPMEKDFMENHRGADKIVFDGYRVVKAEYLYKPRQLAEETKS